MNAYEKSSAVIDRRDAATYIGVGLSTLNELTMSGKIPSITLGKRKRLYRVAALDRWLEEQEDSAG